MPQATVLNQKIAIFSFVALKILLHYPLFKYILKMITEGIKHFQRPDFSRFILVFLEEHYTLCGHGNNLHDGELLRAARRETEYMYEGSLGSKACLYFCWTIFLFQTCFFKSFEETLFSISPLVSLRFPRLVFYFPYIVRFYGDV